jgi:S-adenosylmethionine synthetase
MSRILVQEAKGFTVSEMDVEIVERKGLGHPDTICDAVMDHISVVLSKTYLERFGAVLHHNCDKGLLAAGRVELRLGGGRVLEPMRLIIGDRATAQVGDQRIKIEEIVVEAAKSWFRDHLPRIDPDRHLAYQVELRPGSEELTGLFLVRHGKIGANDTSAAVGYAPLSATERIVLAAERYLNSPECKTLFPETGEDVKIMGVRTGGQLELTGAVPFIDRYIENEAEYFRRKEAVTHALHAHLEQYLTGLDNVAIHLNTLDRRGAGLAGMYLSVLGTSAEQGDSGEVGRGNQVNGLISLNRPRGSEAAAGKNPVSHVGKIYSILAHLLAARIHADVPGVREVTVWLCSRIGDPVDEPQIVSVQTHLLPGITLPEVSDPIRRLIKEDLARLPDFCMELAQGRYPVC